jgi:hypothetical protein
MTTFLSVNVSSSSEGGVLVDSTTNSNCLEASSDGSTLRALDGGVEGDRARAGEAGGEVLGITIGFPVVSG